MSRFVDRWQKLDQIGAIICVRLILGQRSFFTTGCVRRVFWVVGNRWTQPFGSYLLATCLDGLCSLYSVVSKASTVEAYISNENDIHHRCDSGYGRR